MGQNRPLPEPDEPLTWASLAEARVELVAQLVHSHGYDKLERFATWYSSDYLTADQFEAAMDKLVADGRITLYVEHDAIWVEPATPAQALRVAA
jgi:hypothetical protein